MKVNLYQGDTQLPLKLEADEENERCNVDCVLDNAALVEACKAFQAKPLVEVKHGPDRKVLCVLQREFAVVDVNKVDVVGSDDCSNTALLFVKLGSFVGCAHFDYGETLIGSRTCGVRSLVEHLEAKADVDADEPLRVWIVGGFHDDKKNTGYMLGMMLAALNHEERRVQLELVCSDKLNDEVRAPDEAHPDGVHFPKVMGAAYSVADGTVVAAHFTHLGPAVGLRAALPLNGKERLYSCYDTDADEICIDFEYDEFELVDDLLRVPDEFLRANLAGCPLQEPERFCSTLRAGLKFLSVNPDCQEYFANGPVRFKRGDLGAWLKK